MAAGAFESLIESGLPRARRPARVLVVGAGMAGLVAGLELERAGHDPLILEARHRVGGRVFTMRDPFAPGLYAEAGAMRIPLSHGLTMAYIRRFGLDVSPFTMHNPNAFCLIDGQKLRIAQLQADPDVLGFDVKDHEHGHVPAQRWEACLQPIVDRLDREGQPAWDDVVSRYDRFSLREFLKDQGWSDGFIEMFGLLSGYEARMNESFLDVVLPELGQCFEDMVEIVGGSDGLPRAFLPSLDRRIRFGARMFAIDQSPSAVTVHYQTAAGRAQVTGDYAIVTLPFAVMRHVEALKPFSHGKERAIRELHYDASGKIFLQCRRRFWEEDDGIKGGGSVSDLPIRNTYYPDHNRETGRGVMLASYTWSEDAQRWGSLSPEDRISGAIDEVAKLHPQIRAEFEVGASHMWHEDVYAGGAFALFHPDQETRLHPSIVQPEGRIHFGGEHASLYHRWIQGAIESGLRAASEVSEAAAASSAAEGVAG